MTLPAIPPIIDAPRTVSVVATPGLPVSTVNVTFPLFGAQEDLTVTVAGAVLPTNLWTFTSPSGPIGLLPLPITDGVVTFTPPIAPPSGTTLVTIQGSWQPRQIMVPQAPGIPRREFNQQYSTIIAGMRDLLDQINALSGGVALPTAPVNTVPPAISGTPQVGQTLTAGSGTWTQNPTSFSFQWLSGGSPISGATASSYVPVTGDIGANISVAVTAINSVGSTTATSASVGPVTAAGTAPANTVLPVISGTAQVGQTLTASQGTWTGSPTGFAFQWLSNGSPISGAASSTYVPVTGNVGVMLSVTVTATNGIGSTPATSASVGPVTAASGGAPSLDFSQASNSQNLL